MLFTIVFFFLEHNRTQFKNRITMWLFEKWNANANALSFSVLLQIVLLQYKYFMFRDKFTTYSYKCLQVNSIRSQQFYDKYPESFTINV